MCTYVDMNVLIDPRLPQPSDCPLKEILHASVTHTILSNFQFISFISISSSLFFFSHLFFSHSLTHIHIHICTHMHASSIFPSPHLHSHIHTFTHPPTSTHPKHFHLSILHTSYIHRIHIVYTLYIHSTCVPIGPLSSH